MDKLKKILSNILSNIWVRGVLVFAAAGALVALVSLIPMDMSRPKYEMDIKYSYITMDSDGYIEIEFKELSIPIASENCILIEDSDGEYYIVCEGEIDYTNKAYILIDDKGINKHETDRSCLVMPVNLTMIEFDEYGYIYEWEIDEVK